MPPSDHSILSSFGTARIGRERSTSLWSKGTSDIETEAYDPFQFAPIEAAPDLIHKELKTFILGASVVKPSTCFSMFGGSIEYKQGSAFSKEFEAAIEDSKRILEIEVVPDDGIEVPYSKETWQRAVRLLRSLAETYRETNPDPMPVPSIGPAVAGSLDLFWELKDLTLLINIPVDSTKPATFYGRRLEASKISGSLAPNDRVRHLTGWLLGGE